CNYIAKPQRAEQSHRPYGVGKILQDCNILQRLQNAAKLQNPYGVGRAALSGSAGQPPCNKLRPDKCN
ncbi:MAG: hypothetical protein RR349_05425, partial [Oscillospiraceae bacterium]